MYANITHDILFQFYVSTVDSGSDAIFAMLSDKIREEVPVVERHSTLRVHMYKANESVLHVMLNTHVVRSVQWRRERERDR